MDYKTQKLINDWKQQVNDDQKANTALAKKLNQAHYLIGLPAIILAITAGVVLLMENVEPNIKVAAGIAGILAGIVSTIQTFYAPAKKSENHRLVVAQLAHVRRDVELFERFLPEKKPEKKQRIREIDDSLLNIEEHALGTETVIKRWPWVLAGFAGSFALIFVLALGSSWLSQMSPTEQIPVDWVSESVQQGLKTWEFDPEDPLVQQRIILVNTWINEIATEKVVTLLTYMNEIDNQEPITLYLTSIGGYTKDAYAIAHAMQASEAPVNTVTLGDCFSACTKVFMSGTGERMMIEDARIAIHTHAYPFDGDPYSNNTVLYQREREFFQANSDIPLDWISREERFYYLSPEDAMTYQLADKIIAAPPAIEE